MRRRGFLFGVVTGIGTTAGCITSGSSSEKEAHQIYLNNLTEKSVSILIQIDGVDGNQLFKERIDLPPDSVDESYHVYGSPATVTAELPNEEAIDFEYRPDVRCSSAKSIGIRIGVLPNNKLEHDYFCGSRP